MSAFSEADVRGREKRFCNPNIGPKETPRERGRFVVVRPAGYTYLEVKVFCTLGKGKGVAGDCESGGNQRQSASKVQV